MANMVSFVKVFFTIYITANVTTQIVLNKP